MCVHRGECACVVSVWVVLCISKKKYLTISITIIHYTCLSRNNIWLSSEPHPKPKPIMMPNHLAPQICSIGNKIIIPNPDVMPTCYGNKEAKHSQIILGRRKIKLHHSFARYDSLGAHFSIWFDQLLEHTNWYLHAQTDRRLLLLYFTILYMSI